MWGETMNHISAQQQTAVPYFRKQRNKLPQPNLQLLAVHKKGAGQIVNINRHGLSFGCLYPHEFPAQWDLDILDAAGSHIENVSVKKIWEIKTCNTAFATRFELMVGVEFINLADSQKHALEQLLKFAYSERAS